MHTIRLDQPTLRHVLCLGAAEAFYSRKLVVGLQE